MLNIMFSDAELPIWQDPNLILCMVAGHYD